jgi:DNA-3-methyladenine glycosylase II
MKKSPRTVRRAVNKAQATSPSTKSSAMAYLKKVDPVLYRAALPHYLEVLAAQAHRRAYDALFPALAGSVVSQQLSTKAADTIWTRLEKACKGAVTPEALLRLRVTTMRKAGLSAAKTKTLKELSRAIVSTELVLEELRTVSEDEAVKRLSTIWGIGTWTAEMFLIFALNREDVFSSGDLGLRRSVEALYGLPKDVDVSEIEVLARRWSPHWSFASRVLWKVRDVI